MNRWEVEREKKRQKIKKKRKWRRQRNRQSRQSIKQRVKSWANNRKRSMLIVECKMQPDAARADTRARKSRTRGRLCLRHYHVKWRSFLEGHRRDYSWRRIIQNFLLIDVRVLQLKEDFSITFWMKYFLKNLYAKIYRLSFV